MLGMKRREFISLLGTVAAWPLAELRPNRSRGLPESGSYGTPPTRKKRLRS